MRAAGIKSNMRFVVYADFLGTTRRYAKPSLVRRSRELLEQALSQRIIPSLDADDMYLYVFSDTVIVTCPQILPLVKAISKLFGHFMGLMTDDDTDDTLILWLRAGIDLGTILQVDHLANGRRIRTIPFLDTSLPKAYKLEQIRKGSRIFVDPSISFDGFGERAKWFYRWRQITGRGEYAKNIGECLWPAIAYDTELQLAQMTQLLHGRWSAALRRKLWEKDEYIDRLLHLDETVKLFVRSASRFCTGSRRNELLLSFLPEKKHHRKNARYEWGLWFQALRGLVNDSGWSTTNRVTTAFEIVKDILRKEQLLQHFVKELDYPDYHDFRDAAVSLGLKRIP